MSSRPAKLGEYVGTGGWHEREGRPGGIRGLLHARGWFIFDRGPSLAEVEALEGKVVLFVMDDPPQGEAQGKIRVLVSFRRLDSEPYTAFLTPAREGA